LLPAVLGLLVCLAAIASGSADVLCLAPALLFGCVLLARRYPGDRLLARLARRTPCRRRAIDCSPARRPRFVAQVPRGGLLMARGLAVRPPPLALA
jgi:hypothetical protein